MESLGVEILPSLGDCSPESIRNKVDLPAPFFQLIQCDRLIDHKRNLVKKLLTTKIDRYVIRRNHKSAKVHFLVSL